MAKKQIPLPSVSRVATNSVAFVELPIGPTYEFINFSLTGTGLAASMVDSIRVLANGVELQNYLNLQQLIDINAYHGRAADTAADFCLWFTNDDYKTTEEEGMEALGTLGLQTLTVELTLNGTWPANGTMLATAYIDTAQQKVGIYNRIKQTAMNSAVAGDIDYDKIVRNGAIYKQIHFFKSDISKIVLEADGVKIIEGTKTQLERAQKNVRPVARVPVTAKCTTLNFALSGFYGDLLRTDGMNDLRARLTLTTAGAVQIVTEQMDVFNY